MRAAADPSGMKYAFGQDLAADLPDEAWQTTSRREERVLACVEERMDGSHRYAIEFYFGGRAVTRRHFYFGGPMQRVLA